MKINKEATLLLLLLIFLLSNPIYASEQVETNTETLENPNTLNELPENTYVQEAYSDNSLKSAISNISQSENKYNEINLETRNYNLKNTLNTELNNQIEKIISINGNNSIIDGNNKRKFAIVDKNITLILNNLTIRNMKFDIGGAISNSGTLIAKNCIFENNTSTMESMYGGGAIFNDGSMNLINCTFKNNYAYKSGSSIYTTGNLNNNTIVNINDCIFENNYAESESTFHTFGTTVVNIVNSTFKNNNAPYGSTIINQNSNLTIKKSMIINENAANIITNNKNLIMDEVNISKNILKKSVLYNDNILIINNSEIYKTSADSILENIYNTQIYNMTINLNNVNNSIICNTPKEESEANLKIEKSLISNNKLNYSGIENNLNSKTMIYQCLFLNNTSTNDSGIIEDFYGQTYVYDSEFINNTFINLFKGNLNNFIEVSDNKYLDNNLNSEMNLNYTYDNEAINIKGFIKTDTIYNTTVNTGNIYLLQENNTLSYIKYKGNEFEMNSAYNNNSNLTLILLYDGLNHFNNQEQYLNISPDNDEYTIKIDNSSAYYSCGDLIQYSIYVSNIGTTTIKNIKLLNIIPTGLSFNSSNTEIENNSIILNKLDINETKEIIINAKVNEYKNLKLYFDIYDVKKDEHIFYEKNVTFLEPIIELNNITASIGDVANITAKVYNFNKKDIDNILFKFQYKTENVNITFENNTINILNYKFKDNLINKKYVIEIICSDLSLEKNFSNTSVVSLSKIDTYSIINTDCSNNLLNISAKFLDNNNKDIIEGTVILKINGKSIKSFKFSNGLLEIINFKIEKKIQSDEYDISLVFVGNNKYNTNTNTSKIILNKKEITMNIAYEVIDNQMIIHGKLSGYSNNFIDEGYVCFKINGKSITEKIKISSQELTIKIDKNYYNVIKNLSMVYYGNAYYEEKYLTIPVE